MVRSEQLFQRCIAFMERNIEKDLKTNDLVAAMGVSKATLSRCFDKHANCGVHEYFLVMRSKEAVRLLRKGFSAKQVTQMMNFSSASYFSAWFKRVTHQTPIAAKLTLESK